jgi:hypothetical protein
MRPFFDLGDDFLARERYALAAAVYRTIAETAIETAVGRDGMTSPEAALAVARQAVEGLGHCLDGASAPGLRRSLLQSLLQIVTEAGTLEAEATALAGDVLIAKASIEERTELATTLRRSAASGTPSGLEALLAQLEAVG